LIAAAEFACSEFKINLVAQENERLLRLAARTGRFLLLIGVIQEMIFATIVFIMSFVSLSSVNAEDKIYPAQSREEANTYINERGTVLTLPGKDQSGSDIVKTRHNFDIPEHVDSDKRTTTYPND
jgi:hypothetical protein